MKFKSALILFGLAILLANSLMFSYIFYTAYFHNYQTIVDINSIGEAHIEFIVLTLGMLAAIPTVFILLKKQAEADANGHRT